MIKEIKNQLEANKQLTPQLAHALLAEIPCDELQAYYAVTTQKIFKKNEHGRLFAWSKALQKWILWLHSEDTQEAVWSLERITDVAHQYEYQVNDRVVYCGINGESKSKIYTVIGKATDGKTLICDDKRDLGGFFMDSWRLATLAELKAKQRVLVKSSY